MFLEINYRYYDYAMCFAKKNMSVFPYRNITPSKYSFTCIWAEISRNIKVICLYYNLYGELCKTHSLNLLSIVELLKVSPVLKLCVTVDIDVIAGICPATVELWFVVEICNERIVVWYSVLG